MHYQLGIESWEDYPFLQLPSVEAIGTVLMSFGATAIANPLIWKSQLLNDPVLFVRDVISILKSSDEFAKGADIKSIRSVAIY